MIGNQEFILIAILVLVVICGLFFYARIRRKETKALTPLSGLAFGCIIAGIVFGEERWLGYGLIGLGVILSVVDLLIKLRKPD